MFISLRKQKNERNIMSTISNIMLLYEAFTENGVTSFDVIMRSLLGFIKLLVGMLVYLRYKMLLIYINKIHEQRKYY